MIFWNSSRSSSESCKLVFVYDCSNTVMKLTDFIDEGILVIRTIDGGLSVPLIYSESSNVED